MGGSLSSHRHILLKCLRSSSLFWRTHLIASANSWLAQLSIKTGNREKASLVLSKGHKKTLSASVKLIVSRFFTIIHIKTVKTTIHFMGSHEFMGNLHWLQPSKQANVTHSMPKTNKLLFLHFVFADYYKRMAYKL